MNAQTLDVHGMVAQLTQWHTHAEIYNHLDRGTAVHPTRVPPLITQLDEADPANTGAAFRATPASRPPISIDALDTLTHIDHESAAWVRRLGHDDPGNTIACVRKVYSLAPGERFCGRHKAVIDKETRKVICCNVHSIERDIRRWWSQARIVSGWDKPAWAPNNTCPIARCGKRRTLRIREYDQTALCTNCRETWDSSSIGLLAEHVRAENGDETAAS